MSDWPFFEMPSALRYVPTFTSDHTGPYHDSNSQPVPQPPTAADPAPAISSVSPAGAGKGVAHG